MTPDTFRHHRSRFAFAISIVAFVLIINAILFMISGTFSSYINLNTVTVNMLAITAAALFYHARALFAQANSAEISNIFLINHDADKKIKAYEELKLKREENSTPQEIEFNRSYAFKEMANFMEALAYIHNAKKVGSVSSCVVEDLLKLAIPKMVKDPEMVKMKNAPTELMSEFVFQEMLEFSRKQVKKKKMSRETIALFEKIMAQD